ncbi:hypothetical protein EK21DRAFT_111552 [Setomelanomma holmii]|uniref:F-box domain-containing protein n=1 Tax=Setomelanomma holmii TaxID=210430 RepID=A0A9P4LN54_9PLEO|nr:hypothetical protein EK21DRAFT_111552 [Setomelanomma holmii]
MNSQECLGGGPSFKLRRSGSVGARRIKALGLTFCRGVNVAIICRRSTFDHLRFDKRRRPPCSPTQSPTCERALHCPTVDFMAASLHNLPDELMLPIALQIGPRDVHSLVLSNRRFRSVAREALVRNATVVPKHIFTLIDLLHQNPELADKMTHLRIGAVDEDMIDEMVELGPAFANMV